LAQLADGETTYIDASQLTAVTGGDVQKRHTVVDASGNYVASSAKMRRILMSSKMAPHKRRIEMEARCELFPICLHSYQSVSGHFA
jgi:hypothetical protein